LLAFTVTNRKEREGEEREERGETRKREREREREKEREYVRRTKRWEEAAGCVDKRVKKWERKKGDACSTHWNAETDTHTPSLDGFPQKLSIVDDRHLQTLVYMPVRVRPDYDLI